MKPGKLYQVLAALNGEFLEIGDVFKVVSFDAALVWVSTANGMTTIRRRWFQSNHLKEL